jgi:hypothetical protein
LFSRRREPSGTTILGLLFAVGTPDTTVSLSRCLAGITCHFFPGFALALPPHNEGTCRQNFRALVDHVKQQRRAIETK